MINFIKGTKMAIIWTVLRIWLGFQWLEAGYYKISSGFDAGGFIQGAIANANGNSPTVFGWYANFLEVVALPNIELFNILVSWGEILVGLGLIVGFATIPALIAGAFMNLNFMLAGVGFSFSGLDMKLFTLALILLIVGKTSYYFGLDRMAKPYIKAFINKKEVAKGMKVSA